MLAVVLYNCPSDNRRPTMGFTKLDYCQYLLSSQINYTLRNMAENIKSFSHDTINRYLRNEQITPSHPVYSGTMLNIKSKCIRRPTLSC